MYILRYPVAVLMVTLLLALAAVSPYPVAPDSPPTSGGKESGEADTGISPSLNITINGTVYEYEVVNVTEMMEERVPDLMTNQSLVDAVRPLSGMSSGFAGTGYYWPGEHTISVWGFNQTDFIELVVTYRCSEDNGSFVRRVVGIQTITLDDLECSHIEILRTTLVEARNRSLELVSPITHRPLPGYPLYELGRDPGNLTDPSEWGWACMYRASFFTKEMFLEPTWFVMAYNLTAPLDNNTRAWPVLFIYTSNGTLLLILEQIPLCPPVTNCTTTTSDTTTSTETTDRTTANNTSEIVNPLPNPVIVGTVSVAVTFMAVAILARSRRGNS